MSVPISEPAPAPLALVVDRDDDTRGMYASYLKETYGDADEAADGRDALVKAMTRRPDVIVTETRLPGIDGFQLCEILRRDSATRSVGIVVVTADGMPATLDRAKGAGADIVLVKPCLPHELLDAIRGLPRPSAPSSLRDLICPRCDRPLQHLRRHEGGVKPNREQWDYYECPAGCGTFQYRHRTRKLRPA